MGSLLFFFLQKAVVLEKKNYPWYVFFCCKIIPILRVKFTVWENYKILSTIFRVSYSKFWTFHITIFSNMLRRGSILMVSVTEKNIFSLHINWSHTTNIIWHDQILVMKWWWAPMYLYQQSIIHQVITDRPRDIWYTMNMCSTNYTKQNYTKKSPQNATLEIFSFQYNLCVHPRASFDKDHICRNIKSNMSKWSAEVLVIWHHLYKMCPNGDSQHNQGSIQCAMSVMTDDYNFSFSHHFCEILPQW